MTVPTNNGSSSPTHKGQDIRIETFESVEKKQQRAAAEKEDLEFAQKLQNEELAKAGNSSGVSRISALLQEEEKSIYRSPYQASSTPSNPPAPSFSSPYSSLTSNYSSTSSSQASPPPPPADLNKFSKSKGISSDQYFGRDLAEQEEYRRSLNKYSNSTSISSDMLYGQDQGSSGQYSTREADNLAGLDFDRLKDSVKGFFDEFR